MSAKGKFIVLEGIDGCGKDTQSDLLKKHFEGNNNFYFTRAPGGTGIGTQKIRELIFNKDYVFSDLAEVLLFYADRAELMNTEIVAKLDSGVNVICNRFELSQYAYQIYGKQKENMREVTDWLTEKIIGKYQPDLYIYYDITVETSEKRRGGRSENNQYEQKKKDFFERVIVGYKKEILNFNHVIVNGEQSKEKVFEQTLAEILKIISK